MTNCRENISQRCCVNKQKAVGYRAVKRIFDVILAFFALVVLALPMLIISIAIKLDSRGPVLFMQNRVGVGGRLFKICKFRSMSVTAPSETATGDLENPYAYITKVGAFLRKTSLDELPQLFNVLRGEMSLIGPRPLIMGESEIHDLRTAADVYSVRPGMTGWAQVNGRDCMSIEEKVAFDAEYIENFSFAFDMKIIFKTVSVVLSGDGYAEGAAECKEESPAENSTISAMPTFESRDFLAVPSEAVVSDKIA